MTRTTSRLQVGDAVAPRELTAIDGSTVRLPGVDRLTHLQFRRYAGCPFCNLHLRSVEARIDEIRSAGIDEVVVFHSTAAALLDQHHQFPFPIVADPGKELYREFGVESGARAVLNPRAWGAALRGVASKGTHQGIDPSGGVGGLPADLLIAPSGSVLAVKYGEHAADQWTVDELLAATEALPE